MDFLRIGMLFAKKIENFFGEKKWGEEGDWEVRFKEALRSLLNWEPLEKSPSGAFEFVMDTLLAHLNHPVFSVGHPHERDAIIDAETAIYNAVVEDENAFIRVFEELGKLGGVTKPTISMFTMTPEGTVANAITDGKIRIIDKKRIPSVCDFESVACWHFEDSKPPAKPHTRAVWNLWRTVMCHYLYLPSTVKGQFPPAVIKMPESFKSACSNLNASHLKLLRGELLAENRKEVDVSPLIVDDFVDNQWVIYILNKYLEIKGLGAREKGILLRSMFPRAERVCEICGNISMERLLTEKEYSCMASSHEATKLAKDHEFCPSCESGEPLINKSQALEYVREFENIDNKLLQKHPELIDGLSAEDLLGYFGLEIFCKSCFDKLRAKIISKDDLSRIESVESRIDVYEDFGMDGSENSGENAYSGMTFFKRRKIYWCHVCKKWNADATTPQDGLVLFEQIIDEVRKHYEKRKQKRRAKQISFTKEETYEIWEASNRDVGREVKPCNRCKIADYAKAMDAPFSAYRTLHKIRSSGEVSNIHGALFNVLTDIQFNLGPFLILKTAYPRTIGILFDVLFKAGLKNWGINPESVPASK